jgi:NAD(P)-dependent dehydrogenase (short-subunit alcohol dehydrogenase family)
MQPWALVTPASRGIGLELARRLLQTTNVPVVATARKDLDQAKESVLQGLKDVKEDRLNVLKVDVLGQLTAEHLTRSQLTSAIRRAVHRRRS